MHLGIAGPIATCDIAPLLERADGLPAGYAGAPLLATLIGELVARGHRVSAFTLSADLPLRTDATVVARGDGLDLHYVPMRPRAWPMNGWRPGRIVDLYRFERRGLQRAMQQARPELVHAHWSYEFAWAALDSGLPHLVTCHDAPVLVARMQRGGWRYAGYRWLRAGMARHVLARARAVTAVSPYMAAAVQDWCAVPVQVVPNPIGREAFARRWTGSPQGSRVLMVCNGFGPLKNAEAALRAFARVSAGRPQAQLAILGDDFGPGERGERWWRAAGLAGCVQFVGRVPHAAVLDAMTSADVLVHPSREESFGAVLAEALAIGLPVVAGARSGAVPWVVGAAGQLVDVVDPDAVAAGLAAVLDADHARREARREAGRRQAQERFSADGVAVAYERHYRAAIAAGRGARETPVMGPA